jgi:hypothetical protein
MQGIARCTDTYLNIFLTLLLDRVPIVMVRWAKSMVGVLQQVRLTRGVEPFHVMHPRMMRKKVGQTICLTSVPSC